MRPRLSRDILIYGVGEVLVKAFGLITLPIYTRIFSPEQYGALSVVLTVAGHRDGLAHGTIADRGHDRG